MCADAVDVLATKRVMALLDIPAIFSGPRVASSSMKATSASKRSTTRSDMAVR
ncbi:hypothetical protein SAMN05216228_1001135 [Rhizobium tibeticum]|uniref:Uncharacterized protein n=1 Tax=Rhizobium tibeticum TaxID=501024 RepID=A0A1H8CHF1_9HYPH|nr:hypothetical protein RTCCBAU85039_0583 [Rhizobium tibeticum]SEM93844.1 hypothetical protein SAMN05216228_1001135 [Rhizobium tibeticum]